MASDDLLTLKSRQRDAGGENILARMTEGTIATAASSALNYMYVPQVQDCKFARKCCIQEKEYEKEKTQEVIAGLLIGLRVYFSNQPSLIGSYCLSSVFAQNLCYIFRIDHMKPQLTLPLFKSSSLNPFLISSTLQNRGVTIADS